MGIYAICLFFGCQIWLTKSAQGKKFKKCRFGECFCLGFLALLQRYY